MSIEKKENNALAVTIGKRKAALRILRIDFFM